ncbi:hypothetical protein KTU01_23570 [Kocuria turfanensis]|uniref:Uncharacterized protein n=1 Tax=Kocuria turfanensis TaxID=388357 RepID=A0A512IEV3_9MICC|nr:hypothetical protein KTU01_23570 [Kocuria turfanensis]
MIRVPGGIPGAASCRAVTSRPVISSEKSVSISTAAGLPVGVLIGMGPVLSTAPDRPGAVHGRPRTGAAISHQYAQRPPGPEPDH